MDALAAALTALLSHASAQPTAGSREQLRGDVAALRALAHGLANMRTPDADPTIGFMLRELDVVVADTARAGDDAIEGAVHAVAWTCMGCHTRSAHGTPRPIASLAPIDASLPADVRGTALAATRRFRDASAVFKRAAFDEELARNEPARWERSVKGALLLDIRVHRDDRAALALADHVVNNPHGEPLWREAADWRRALAPFVKEQRAWPGSVVELDAEGTRLIAEANARTVGDAARDVLFLRASAIAHELLMAKDAPPDMRVQALAWLGESYRALRDLDIWFLHLLYDAACVEAAPHSLIAGECYTRWREGALSVYSGNSGQELPAELAQQDEHLRRLAAP